LAGSFVRNPNHESATATEELHGRFTAFKRKLDPLNAISMVSINHALHLLLSVNHLHTGINGRKYVNLRFW
jgi:hypothetical protein